MTSRRVAIIGVGLMGGSVGLALKDRGLADTVVGIGRRQSSLDRARQVGACDEVTTDVASGIAGAGIVVAACPVSLVVPLLEEAARNAEPGAILTDVASTKTHIVRALESRLSDSAVHFVGGHPLAGSEKSGVQNAGASLYDGATVVLTPTETTDLKALKQLSELWEGLGATVRTLRPEEHDAILAQTSHLPHLVAAALVAALGSGAEEFVGPGFLDTTRVAGGDPELWRDIFLSNATEVARSLARFRTTLAALENGLAADPAELVELLRKAQEGRLALGGRRPSGAAQPPALDPRENG
jgi:prephenate dehydrogenase